MNKTVSTLRHMIIELSKVKEHPKIKRREAIYYKKKLLPILSVNFLAKMMEPRSVAFLNCRKNTVTTK